jgi:L,D-transpeptidase YcbB
MRGSCLARVLAGTAVALIFALPPDAPAQDTGTIDNGKFAAAPSATPPAEPPKLEAPSAIPAGAPSPGVGPAPAASNPPIATEQKPDPLASLDPADRAIAERIRDLLVAKADRIFASRKDRTVVEAFYQNRNLAPFWFDRGVENARAKSVVARLKNADSEGLEPGDYKTPDLGASGSGPDGLAEAELKLTQTVLTYARHVQAGRFPYSRLSRNIELPQSPPDPAEVLGRIANAADAGKVLDDLSPQNEPYRKLKAMLAQLRGRSGNLDAGTIRELNGPTHGGQIDTIIVNMERWRWYPRDLGKAHVLVNEPDFTLKVMHDGKEVWTTRLVIGKPGMQTPLLSETMKYITINPTWNVPPSIVYNEYLPALAQDPTVLARMGLHVSYSGGGVHISQPPGERNALGRIRFNFPNRFLVYQHDTPDKYMFGHDVRAESHGCMRVQDPAKYAELLFNIARPDEHWTAEKVASMFGRTEQDIQIQPAQVWVHLTYQTAFVDDAGKLQIRRDVYNLDSRTLAAIKSERGVVESPSERKHEQEIASGTGRRPARAARSFFPSVFSGGPYGGGSNGSPYGRSSGRSYGDVYARPRPPRGVYYR